MNLLRRLVALVAAGALSLGLAACDNSEALAKACSAKDAVYSTWSVWSAAFGASAKTQAGVTLAYNAATTACLAKDADPTTALVTVSAAAAQIAIGVKEIKKKHPAAVLPAELVRVVRLAPAGRG